MAFERGRIRVKSMLIVPNREGTTHAVSLLPPTAENPHGYHRLIGGTINLGETHEAAIRREVHEELGAEVNDLTLLGTVENIYTYNGELGHEIVFIYIGSLDPEPAPEGAVLTEDDGSVLPVVWRPMVDTAESLPLYPDGALDLLKSASYT